MSPRCPHFFAKQAQSPQAISGQPHFPYSPCNRTTPHTHLPLSINSQKTAKPASPRFAGHTPQPMPGCFPRASDPPYHYQAPKIRRQFRRDQRPGPANPQPWATPARPCLHRPSFTSAHGHQPAETSGRSTQMRIQPTHTNSRRRRGGHGRQGTASLRDATTLRRLRRRRLEGQCLFTLAEYRKAVECFDKAAGPDSGCTTAYAGHGEIAEKAQETPETRQML